MLEKAKKNAQNNQENLINWAFQKWIFCSKKITPKQSQALTKPNRSLA
jgi:hypothetical protein